MPIPARFHKYRDKVVSSGDKLFSETVLICHLKNGIKDTDRENIKIEAVLRVFETETSGLDGGRNKNWPSRVSANKAELYIDINNYSEIDIRTGDKIRAISRNGAPWFEVLSPATRGHTRLIYSLGVA